MYGGGPGPLGFLPVGRDPEFYTALLDLALTLPFFSALLLCSNSGLWLVLINLRNIGRNLGLGSNLSCLFQ